ncbi:g1971 [Coccomyxa viridis]|uniref:G1971 protein n=1 Tax=Coccomyxa viridis TaxID=1274662 RepID=A0ABP1FJ86_9CHLO
MTAPCNPIALKPPPLSLQTLETLLNRSNDTLEQASHSEASRRLKVASMVYSRWTEGGKDEAVLAERYLDGTIDVLDLLLCEDSCRTNWSPVDHGNKTTGPCSSISGASTLLSRPADRTASSVEPDQEIQTGVNHTGGMRAGIPRRSADQLTYDDFVLQYMAPNLPVMIQGVTQGWAASRDWVDEEGEISLSFLAERFGNAQIWATECTSAADGYGGGRRHEMSLREYAAWWKQDKAGLDDRLLYLKDWHFVNEFPDYQAYSTPPFFRDDWLNDYYDMRSGGKHSDGWHEDEGGRSHDSIVNSDYRFVYLGPAGTKTPVHADVLNSFSWSVNLAGCKLWRLLPPQHTHLLYDRFGNELAPAFDADEARPGHFTNLAAARKHAVEVQQGIGEAIFVPSGWHHTVENLEDTLSINHNWLNGFNLHWAWELLQKEYAGASAAIDDCRATCSGQEFEALVQRNMAANCGMDFRAAGEFVASIALRELQLLEAAGALSVAVLGPDSRNDYGHQGAG